MHGTLSMCVLSADIIPRSGCQANLLSQETNGPSRDCLVKRGVRSMPVKISFGKVETKVGETK